MKKIFKTAVSAVLMLSVTLSANAMTVSFLGENSSIPAQKIHFEGKLDKKGTNRIVMLYILKPNSSEISEENILHTQSAEVLYDGSFEFTFGFPQESGDYPVHFIASEESCTSEYNYRTWTDICDFLIKCKSKIITYQELAEFEDMLSVDFSIINDDDRKNVLVKRICDNSGDIAADMDGVKAVIESINNVFEEFKCLDEIKTVQNWSYLPGIFDKLTLLTGIDFDYKNADKKSVCSPFIGQSFKDTESLVTKFNQTVKELTAGNGGNLGGGNSSGGIAVTGGSGASVVLQDGILNNSAPSQIKNNSGSFEDLDSVPWAVKAINYLYNSKIVNGVSETEFAPNAMITREQLVKIAALAFGIYDENAVSSFVDVDNGEWYAPYVASVQNAGIVTGMGDNIFGTGRLITRQDMSVIIKKCAEYSGYEFKNIKNDFNDWDNISEYAKDSIETLAGDGHINGMDNNCFNPFFNATRAQAAKIIYSIIGGEK